MTAYENTVSLKRGDNSKKPEGQRENKSGGKRKNFNHVEKKI